MLLNGPSGRTKLPERDASAGQDQPRRLILPARNVIIYLLLLLEWSTTYIYVLLEWGTTYIYVLLEWSIII